MATALRIALGAGGAAVAGVVAGLIAALITLAARRWRNGRLVARGQPPYRDVLLPRAFPSLCAVASLIAGGALGAFVPWTRAALVGALAPASLLALLGVGAAVHQALRERHG